jgi:hypothetical protein
MVTATVNSHHIIITHKECIPMAFADLLKQAESIDVAASKGQTQAVRTVKVDPAKWQEYVAPIVEQHMPNAELNSAAISKGGTTASGAQVVLFAVKQTFPMKASVTVYHNGTVVLAGLPEVA